MLGKFKPGWDFVGPLAAHCAVHAVFDLFILALQGMLHLWWLAVLDFVIHFVMDRVKASPQMLGRFKALSANEMKNILSYVPTLGEKGVKEKFGKELKSNVYFWWSLGVDQMVHHLTDILLIYLILVL